MTKRERVFAMLENRPADRNPVGFWFHFPEEMHHGEAAVQGHLDLMEQTGTDLLKVMNENILCDEGVRITRLDDIGKFRAFSRKERQFSDQMGIISRICDKAKGECPVVATVHGLVVSAFHQTGFAGHYTDMGYGLALFCRERPAEMKNVFGMVAESLIEMVDCSLEAGADGIFYAALGGERQFWTDEEFAEFIAPWEKKVYDHIKRKTALDILHICKSNINLERYVHLEPSVVNWSIYQNGVSLAEGAKLFPESVLLGGFQDRSGILVEGSDEEIRQHVAAILEETAGSRLIVGADCTLPTGIDPKRIKAVVEAVDGLAGA